MKKQILLFVLLYVFICNGIFAQEDDTVAAWTFPTGVDSVDIYANAGLSVNLNKDISAEDTSAVIRDVYMTNGSGGTGDYAGTAVGWDNGKDAKLWSIKFKAEGYTDLKISSKQRSGGNNPGPRDWKLQCCFSGEDWADISGGTVTCANNWTIGVVEELPLPPEFDDPGSSSIYIRWIMTSDTSINGGLVDSLGVSKIDDVIITGISSADVEDIVYSSNLNIYPNPAQNNINIESVKQIESVVLYNMQGKKIKQIEKPDNNNLSIDVSNMAPGIYLIHATLSDQRLPYIRKFIVE